MHMAGSNQTGAGRARRMKFGHDAGAPGRARRLVGEVLGGDALADDVRLVVSELVTNVLRHAATGGTLRLLDARPEGSVRVEVFDDEAATIAAVHPVRRANGGQGLRIVQRTSTRWGVEVSDRGKTVWAEFG